MKSFLVLTAILLGSAQVAHASSTSLSCFTTGYEPGMTIEINFESNGDINEFKSFNLMPDSSQANLSYYGSNVKTTQKLEDGRIAFTAWDFSKVPTPEATLILDVGYRSGIFILKTENAPLPDISSVSCSAK